VFVGGPAISVGGMKSMTRATKPSSPLWLTALQIAIIVASIALSLVSQIRVGAVAAPFLAASLGNCALMLRSDWKSGLLSMTPGQLLRRAQAGEKFPRQTLGFAAVVASSIAEWHITMG
jgi:hypothetical protein